MQIDGKMLGKVEFAKLLWPTDYRLSGYSFTWMLIKETGRLVYLGK